MNKNSESKVAEKLISFEKKTKAYSYTVRGVSVWRLIRSPVGYAMQDLPIFMPRLKLYDLLIACMRSMWDMITLSESVRYVVKSYSSAMRVSDEGYLEDIYFHELLSKESGGLRLSSLNTVVGPSVADGERTKSFDCTAILVIASIMAFFFPVRDKTDVFKKLSEEIEKELDIQHFPATYIRQSFSSFWWQTLLFDRLFQKLSPQVVIISDAGERAVIAACRRSRIKVIELQHGVFTNNDPDCLPFDAFDDANERSLLLPDVLALYGDYWVEKHKNTLMGRLGRITVVGADIIDRYRDKRTSLCNSRSNCLKFVVTSQGLDREQLINFLLEFLSKCSEPCKLYIKLHPIYDVTRSPFVDAFGDDERVHIISGLEEPNTLDLIVDADLHISIASACHYEALGIGCPSLVLGLSGHEPVYDLIQEGYTLYATTPEELVQIVKKKCFKTSRNAPSEIFYSKGFVRRISALIS
jgi:hypothetical protein